MMTLKSKHYAISAAAISAVLMSTPVSAETCDLASTNDMTHQISASVATVHTSVLIDASPSDVWQTLLDFDSMPTWSSAIQGVTGDLKDGNDVVVTYNFGVDDSGAPITNEIPHKLIFSDGETFGWSDPLPEFLGGGKDKHLYQVIPCGEKTLFVQSDEVIGNPNAMAFVNQLLPTYQLFNAELKQAVESN